MGVPQKIWIKNKTYYLHDTYNSREKAYKIARQYKATKKKQYFIIKMEPNKLFPITTYALYLTRVKPLI